MVKDFAKIVIPLTELIRLNPSSKKLELNSIQKSAIDKIKGILSSVTPLAHPGPVSHYQLVTDSSQFAIGAALHMMVENEPIPIGFFSKKLSQQQCKYSTFDRELLAAYSAVLYFKHLIEGRNVVILTDHKPLCNAFLSKNPSKSDRQQRQISVLTEYVTQVLYIRGEHNIVADCLSRPAMSITLDICDLAQIVDEQNKDEEVKDYIDNLKRYKYLNTDSYIYCDISSSYPRPYIPNSLRQSIFDSIHQISHPGTKATVKLLKLRYFWPFMEKSIKQYCKECTECQKAKINRHTKSPIEQFSLPSSRFESVHLDIVGPLPAVKQPDDPTSISSYRYLLTCLDRGTRWIEACPLSDITAQTIAKAFVDVWVSRFGVPLHVITDRGSQFESELFNELSNLLGFHRLRTTAYRPQTNGMIERFHRVLKTSLKARSKNWLISLPIVLLGIRSTPNETNFSPFYALTGSHLLIPQILINSDNERESSNKSEYIRNLARIMSKFETLSNSDGIHHGKCKSYIPNELESCEKVWLRIDRVRKPLECPYTGPHRVLKRSNKFFVIEIHHGVNQTVTIDRLKPCVEKTNKSIKPLRPTDSDYECVEPHNIEKKSSSGRKIKWKTDDEFYYY